ncbi:MAG: hypothetical protein IPM38_13770 [Ignavibacteria bacterium]|nr:hypothetical protein [Ignavibacteria bacterium]
MKKNGKSNLFKVTSLILVISCSLLFSNISNSQSAEEDLQKTADTIAILGYALLGAAVVGSVVYLIVSSSSKNEMREKRKAIEEKNRKQTDSTSAVKTDTTSLIKTDTTKIIKQIDGDK